jgi:hypothetical protein
VVSLRDQDLRIAYLAYALITVFIGTVIYLGYDRHYGTLWILFIGLHWIRRERGRPSMFFLPIIALAAIVGAAVYLPILSRTFAGGPAAAEWIISHSTPQTVVAAYPGPYGLYVSARTARPTFNLPANRWNTFLVGDQLGRIATPAELLERIRRLPGDRVLIISRTIDNGTLQYWADHGVSVERVASFDGIVDSPVVYQAIASPAR